MSSCMVCQRSFEPYLKFQLCCSLPCCQKAGRWEKEGIEVVAWLDNNLQEAFRRSMDGMDICGNVGVIHPTASDL